uniref:L1 transposable element RRM domain-containing protein n=1 Tax=Oryzias melastigma TaxID=30732 RepID=A0A3B3DK96_ORYME
MAGGASLNCEELSVLIRTIIREEIGVAMDKLQANEGLRKENKALKEKADRMEDRSRKYNIRILGVTTDVEKGNPTSYMSALLEELFKDKIQRAPEVEAAYRTGPKNKSGHRVMIVRMHRLTAREEILRAAKKERKFDFHGMILRFFPDLTAEIVKARDSFREVRAKLGETKKFMDHQAAGDYVKTQRDKLKSEAITSDNKEVWNKYKKLRNIVTKLN